MKTRKLMLMSGVLLLALSCNNDSDQNPTPSDELQIAAVSTGKFWGDELIIDGSGFSADPSENIIVFENVFPSPSKCNINYTSDGGAIEILSASETQLKIKVPARLNPFGDIACGPVKADLAITVNGKTANYTGMSFGNLPYLGGFLYHYGWFDAPKVTRIGDSVMLDAGLKGEAPRESPYWDKIRLTINGDPTPIKFRSIGLESGFSLYLPVAKYAEKNCSDDPDGWAARGMDFKIYIEGTDKSVTQNLLVQFYPEQVVSCFDCPSQVPKNGTDIIWKIKGKNISVTEARFTSLDCGGPTQSMAINVGLWTDEFSFSIPSSILSSNCTYSVVVADECHSFYLGNLAVSP